MIFKTYEELALHLDLYNKGAPIVLTNGCFDIIHAGHVTLLKKCKGRAIGLSGLTVPRGIVVVALDSDDSVTALKGEGRPICTFADRALVVNSIKSVDYVVKMESHSFHELIAFLCPRSYIKGSQYEISDLCRNDVFTLEEVRCKIEFVDMYPDRSTTSTLTKIQHMMETL